MNWGFLFPLAWLGAVAVAVPVWLHLHRRFQGNVLRFPAMQFLHDEPLARRAPLRLQNPLLFALRAAAVLLLAAAFAWPYDRTQVAPPSIEARVYLIDNTLSHQAGGQFEEQRDEVADAIAALGADTQVAVVELAGQPRVLVPFGHDRASAAEVVRSLEPSFERGSYTAALRLADTLLRSSIGDARRLFVHSDHQANQYDELRESPPFMDQLAIESASPERDARPNAALARPQLRRMFVGDRSVLELAVELYHRGEIKRGAIKVVANGVSVLDRSIDFEDQPERVLVTVRWSQPRDAAVRGQATVTCEADSLAGDDTVYFALPAVERGRVALAARSIFLAAAFAPDVMQEAWHTDRIEPAQSIARHNPGDVLCLETRYFRESTAAKALVSQYLEADRGVLLIVDEAGPAVAAALAELGFTIESEPVIERQGRPAGYVQREHPIFQPFRSADFGNLTDVRFVRHFPVQTAEGTPLLFDDAGRPLLFEAAGHRKLLVAAFPFDRAATDWPIQPTFVPFLDQCLQFLRPPPPASASLTPREVAVFHLKPDSTAREFRLSDQERQWDRGSVDNRRVQVTAPARPGIYELLFDDANERPIWLAVNPPPAESELEYADPTELFASIAQPVEETGKPAPATLETTAEPSRAEILQQRLWWVILLVALFMLFGENLYLAAGRLATGPGSPLNRLREIFAQLSRRGGTGA